jgi:hypothetical protein
LGTESKRLQFKETKVPGPGSYSQKGTNSKQTFSFSKSGLTQAKKITGPGPGAYEINSSIGEVAAYSKR